MSLLFSYFFVKGTKEVEGSFKNGDSRACSSYIINFRFTALKEVVENKDFLNNKYARTWSWEVFRGFPLQWASEVLWHLVVLVWFSSHPFVVLVARCLCIILLTVYCINWTHNNDIWYCLGSGLAGKSETIERSLPRPDLPNSQHQGVGQGGKLFPV